MVFGIVLMFFLFLHPNGLTGYSVFQSMDKYNFDELPDFFEIIVGNEFAIDIELDGNYVFSDNSELFDINNETGIIYFVPENEGNFSVVVIALKDVENFEYKLVNFLVVEE